MSFRPAGNVLRSRPSHVLDNICWRCSTRRQLRCSSATSTTSPAPLPFRRPLSHVAPLRQVLRTTPVRLKAGYFLPNELSSGPRSPRGGGAAAAAAGHDLDSDPGPLPPLPPHRRRQKRQRDAATATGGTQAATSSSGATSPPEPGRGRGGGLEEAASEEDILPTNASTTLTDASTRHPAGSLRRQLSLYLSLSKPRLTVLIVLTAMAPYALYPVPDFASSSLSLGLGLADDVPSLSPLTLAFLTAGTALCSASANTLNMLYERVWDAQMSRTRNRPLVRRLVSPHAALAFALLTALAGVGGLYFGVNPTVAFLGGANIALYAGVYTPLKRVSWLNTWAGAVVGGIPPLMGWAAAAGEYATGSGSFGELLLAPEAVGGWLFAALLFAWQFSHFMALSWSIRDEYRRAGYQMLCWVDPARNARVALRYSLAFLPICLGLCAAGVTEWSFALTSLPVNLWLARRAVAFHRHEGARGSARGLFWASVWHIPAVMVLALVQKKGMWGRVWRSVVGEPMPDDEDGEGYDEDDYLDEEGAVRDVSK